MKIGVVIGKQNTETCVQAFYMLLRTTLRIIMSNPDKLTLWKLT